MSAVIAMTMPGKAVKFASRNPLPPNSGAGLLPKMRPMHAMKAGAKRTAKMTVTGSRRARIAVTRHSWAKVRMAHAS